MNASTSSTYIELRPLNFLSFLSLVQVIVHQSKVVDDVLNIKFRSKVMEENNIDQFM